MVNRTNRGDGQPLQVDYCRREIYLDGHILQTATHRTSQTMLRLGFSMNTFNKILMTVVQRLCMIIPPS